MAPEPGHRAGPRAGPSPVTGATALSPGWVAGHRGHPAAADPPPGRGGPAPGAGHRGRDRGGRLRRAHRPQRGPPGRGGPGHRLQLLQLQGPPAGRGAVAPACRPWPRPTTTPAARCTTGWPRRSGPWSCSPPRARPWSTPAPWPCSAPTPTSSTSATGSAPRSTAGWPPPSAPASTPWWSGCWRPPSPGRCWPPAWATCPRRTSPSSWPTPPGCWSARATGRKEVPR